MSNIANIKSVSNVHLFIEKCNLCEILIGFPYA